MTGTDPAIFAARLAAEIAQGAAQQPRIHHATLLEYSQTSEEAWPMARVHMDGDPATEIRTVAVIMPVAPQPGDRVSVLYDPPQGAYVVGSVTAQQRFVTGGGPSCVTAVNPKEVTSGRTPRFYPTSDVTLTSCTLSVENSRVGDIECNIEHNGATVDTITLPAGDNLVTLDIADTDYNPPTDYLSATISDNGASDVCLEMWFAAGGASGGLIFYSTGA